MNHWCECVCVSHFITQIVWAENKLVFNCVLFVNTPSRPFSATKVRLEAFALSCSSVSVSCLVAWKPRFTLTHISEVITFGGLVFLTRDVPNLEEEHRKGIVLAVVLKYEGIAFVGRLNYAWEEAIF